MNLKRLVILLIATLGLLKTSAQTDESYFIIKGKVLNSAEDKWEFGMTTFFENIVHQLKISKDGSFSSQFAVSEIQDIYLYLNGDAITIGIYPMDTLDISWDNSNFASTFKISSNNQLRAEDLQMDMKLYKEFREPYLSLRDKLYKERMSTDSMRYSWINHYYNKIIRSIIEDTSIINNHSGKHIVDAYYSCMSLLREQKLYDKFSLVEDSAYLKKLCKLNILPVKQPDFKILNFTDFTRSPEYRNFLYNYLRFESPLSGFQSDLNEVLPFTPVIDDYYSALAFVKLPKIRDWLITYVIISGYSYYPYEECEFVYNDFINKCKTQYFTDTLTKFHDFIDHFKPGEPAPDFILTNELGENITLSSLQGKVLYVDFWGVGCAPCRTDIANYVPKLHEKYKGKNVAFVNICVDSDEESWKKAIYDLNLEGINLIAEGWLNNPICKLYNIKGIPHYVIIDKNGNYVAYNGSRPWELIKDNPNDIDKALKQ